MENFWDSSVWGSFNLIAVLLIALLTANLLKRTFPFLQKSLIPTSVLGGLILLILSVIYKEITGENVFNTEFFNGNGLGELEVVTYHTLALGFIAQTLKTSDKKLTKERGVEIFNTGVTTVSTYLMQGVLGIGITILIAAFILPDFFPAAGVLLPFGYGQGTGQAMNYGLMYEGLEAGKNFVGGKNFGLTVAALGFLSASIGGVIYLNAMKRRGKIIESKLQDGELFASSVQSSNEIPMNGSIDKITVQVAFIALSYVITFGIMSGLGLLLPGMKLTIFGFNFLLGVLSATLVKGVLQFLNKRRVMKRQYTNNFLLTRISNFFFDLMVIAGIAAIQIDLIKQYWWILLLLGVVGLVSTYAYNRFVARKLFQNYEDEQFLAMYGMLTGTASTGIVLLREIDGEFKTPVADNLVYQNFPAIVFGFPMMLLATLAPKDPILTLILLAAFFLVMNVILFRAQIFKKKKTVTETKSSEEAPTEE